MFLEFWNSSPFQGFQNGLNRIFLRAVNHIALPIPGRIELSDKFRAFLYQLLCLTETAARGNHLYFPEKIVNRMDYGTVESVVWSLGDRRGYAGYFW